MSRRHPAQSLPDLHPLPALVHAGALLVFLLAFSHPLFLLALALVPGVTLAARGQGTLWRRYLAWNLTFAGFVIAFNGLFGGSGATVLFLLRLPLVGTRVVSLESLSYGAAMAVRLAGIFGTFALLTGMVDCERLLYFSPLAGRASLTAALSLSLIPRLSRSARTLLEVQASRGAPVTATNLRRGVQAVGPLLAALSETALEASLDMAEVLAARGYGTGRPTNFRPRRWHARDTLILLGSLSALASGLRGLQTGLGSFTYYPSLGDPGQGLVWPDLVLILGGLALPAAIFWGWRYCRWLRVNI